jgi:UDP-N-acetyl-D-mannosaminuronic acid dehydrogenase
VYPHLLLARAPGLELIETSRRVNDAQADAAVAGVAREIGDLRGAPVLVLGLTYREGVKELAYSVALRLIPTLAAAGAEVHAHDPLLSDEEVAALGARPWRWGTPAPFRAVVAQTGDRAFAALDPAWFPELRVVYDGRNRLRGLRLPDGVAYLGVGVQDATRGGPDGA